MTPQRFPDEVVRILEEAGWDTAKDRLQGLELPVDFDLFPLAETILREFGGLRIGRVGSGVDFARSDVRIYPMAGAGFKEEVSECPELPAGLCYPLGDFHREHGLLFIFENGEIYYLFDGMTWLADSFDAALVALLLGIRPVPKPP